MKEAGFIEIFVNNDAQTPVYFDNFRVTQSTSCPVSEVNAYYPFGMIIGGLSLQAVGDRYNAYKYNGKELQDTTSTAWLDFGARMLDGPRWIIPDPLAEKYYSISPYVYCANNPIRFIDPDGLDWYESESGEVMWVDENDRMMKKKVAGWKPLGDTYKGFKIAMSNPVNYQHENGRFSSMGIEITYDGGEAGEEYGWTQVIRVDPAQKSTNYGYERGEEFVDFSLIHESYYPLYNGEFSKDNLEFRDSPENWFLNTHKFSGEVSLLNRTKTKTEMSTGIVATFKWGFSLKNGNMTIDPVRLVTPSKLMNKIVYEISRKK